MNTAVLLFPPLLLALPAHAQTYKCKDARVAALQAETTRVCR